MGYRYVVLCVLCAVFAVSAQSVKFEAVVAPDDSNWVVKEMYETEMNMSIKVQGNVVQSGTQKSHHTRERKDTVLEAGKDCVTKLKVEYRTNTKTELGPMGDKSMDEPVSGKTYIVQAKSGKISAAYAEGGEKPSKEEMAVIMMDHKALGKKTAVIRILKGKQVKSGKKMDVPKDLAKELLGGQEGGFEIQKFAMTFKSTQEVSGFECAVFDIVVKMGGDPMKSQKQANAKMEFKVDLKGEMVVGVKNCLLVSLNLKGPISLNAAQRTPDGQKVEMSGEGTMAVDNQYQYELK